MAIGSSPIGNMIIKVDLDSTGFSKSMTGLNRQLKSVNTEMRANLSQFSRSEKSVGKYTTQIDSLTKRHRVQEKAVEQARKEYEDIADVHGKGSAKAEEYAIKLNEQVALFNETGIELSNITDEFKAFQKQQEIQSSTMYKTGDSLVKFGTGLQGISEKAGVLGRDLTRKITLPALGVVTAVGGITAAFGWQRLVGLDTAQAQLKGLGYNTKEVGRISDQVTSAIDGGMTTMAEGTAVAAGALAAGVKEGAELERYIKLVGDAAVGSNRPVADMAQIFNRVQGSGKLMTQELNMIEQGMPGFAQAMADNLADGSLESFREMVTNGEIGSDEFMDVMDDFAGGMAEAYADSWSGMVANTKAYVGIIGENLLGGVFEQSKESIAEFIKVLSSEKTIAWAEKTGQAIGEIFSGIVEKVKIGINWFKNLSTVQQKLLGVIALIVVSIGPALTAFSIFGGIIAKLSIGLGSFMQFLSPLTKGFGLFGGAAAKTGGAVAGTGKTVGLLSRAFTFLTGPIGIAIGVISLLVAGFTTAYKRSETFRNLIHDLGEKLKEIFFGIVEWIQPGLDAVTNFFGQIKEKINIFKNEEGASFLEAWQNIADFIMPILEGIWSGIKWVFDQIKWIIADYVMPVIAFVIEMVWNNIKGVITGVLDVIMGAVKIFSGLFTGNWSKMWEGTQQLVVGAVKAVWNYINLLFIGRILKGIGVLVKSFGGLIGRMWTGAKTTFSNGISVVWNWMKNSFVGRIISSIINFVRNFRTNLTTMWTRVKNLFTSRINEVRNSVANSFIGRIISSIINFTKNFRQNLSNMWARVRSLFTDRINSIRNSIANSFVGRMLTSVRNLRTNFVNIAKDMWSGVKKQFGNIVDGAKALPGRIGKGISNAKSKAVNGMKSVGRGIMNAAGKPINSTIDGVNWILRKVKAPEIKGKWKIPQYAKGTGIGGHKGGIAMIGEEGRELVKLPNGQSFVSPNSHTMLDLPKGSQVIPNQQTEQILKSDLPHYAKGTKGWKSTLSDIWSFIKKPIEAVKTMMSGIKIGKGTKGMARNVAVGGLNYLKDKPIDYIKGIFSKQEESEHNPNFAGGKPAFGFPITSSFGYRIHPITGGRKLHAGTDFGAPGGTPIPSQTGGKVSHAGWAGGYGNLVKVRQGIWEMYYAHMSKIMTSAGKSVKKGDILGLVGSTGASTGNHLHYETRRNGNPIDPMSLKGFATGGLIDQKQLAWLAEDGFAEMVIPLDPSRRPEAMKLLALTAQMIDKGKGKGGSKLPHQLSNVRGGSNDEYYKKMLDAQLEQNKQMAKTLESQRKTNDILTQILAKDIDISTLGKAVEPTVTKQQNNKQDMRLAYQGY